MYRFATFQHTLYNVCRGRRDYDRMVVWFTATCTCAISPYIITTKVVSSLTLFMVKCTLYNIMW